MPGLDLSAGPTALWFYKVTCPVCQMTAPVAEGMERAYPGRIAGVGQDPQRDLAAFAGEYTMSFSSLEDAEPYEVSDEFGIEIVPSLVLMGSGGEVLDAVESWDREGYNRISARIADLTGTAAVVVSDEGDGLPPFRPG